MVHSSNRMGMCIEKAGLRVQGSGGQGSGSGFRGSEERSPQQPHGHAWSVERQSVRASNHHSTLHASRFTLHAVPGRTGAEMHRLQASEANRTCTELHYAPMYLA